MKVAILSRPGDCFPNIISIGLSGMLTELGVDHKIFYDAIPFLMRILPFSQKPKRWANNFHYRVYNKLKYYKEDKKLLKELAEYDLIILSECLPNAFWKNYLAIETLRSKLSNKPVIPYLDAYIDNAPIHQEMWFDNDDHNGTRYDYHLCPTELTELKNKNKTNWAAIGINISPSGLKPVKKDEFIAVIDFLQPGYEAYRDQQIKVLNELGIKTIILQGRYPMQEIRKIYQKASIFFLAFPETYGLPIAECFACGTYVFTPNAAWPMSWRLEEYPMPWAAGTLPDCFRVYNDEKDLRNQIILLREGYDPNQTPLEVHETFLRYYRKQYYGDINALRNVLNKYANV